MQDISEFFIAATIAGLVGWLLPGYLEMIPVPPVWVFVAIGVPLLIWLGYLGRPMDKPVLSGAVAAATEPPLGAPMVIRALTSLGNSKMSPKTQMDPATQITLWTDLHREGPGVIGDFVLPEGVPASFVVGKREEFAAALRRPLGCCWPSVGDKHPGHLVVFITRKPMSQAEQEPWPLLKRGEVNIFHSFPAFTDQKNQWVGLTLAYASMIVGAVPRMGKTFVVRELLLASGLDKRVRVAAIDGKGTGDLSACALYADFYSRGDREEELHRVRDYLRGLKREVQRRADVIDGLTREEAPESKVDDRLASKRSLHLEPIVVGIDETQTYFEEAPEKLCNEFVELVTYLVKKGSGAGGHRHPGHAAGHREDHPDQHL